MSVCKMLNAHIFGGTNRHYCVKIQCTVRKHFCIKVVNKHIYIIYLFIC